MNTPLVNGSDPQRRLTQAEIEKLFVITLADIYTSKSSLMMQIPSMARKVTSKELKMHILGLGSIVNGQRIRLRLAISLMRKGGEPQEIIGNLNLDKYLNGHIISKSFETDAIYLTHLIIAESIEVASFKLLISLTSNLYPKTVGDLLKACLKEAQASKRSLEELLTKNYLATMQAVL